jgi:hypothetical protein
MPRVGAIEPQRRSQRLAALLEQAHVVQDRAEPM